VTALVLQLIAVTTGVGAVIILLGLSRGLLHARDTGRRCPSCGRLINGRVCRACAGRAR
jgi:recombinational DNA repair protein RecR